MPEFIDYLPEDLDRMRVERLLDDCSRQCRWQDCLKEGESWRALGPATRPKRG